MLSIFCVVHLHTQSSLALDRTKELSSPEIYAIQMSANISKALTNTEDVCLKASQGQARLHLSISVLQGTATFSSLQAVLI